MREESPTRKPTSKELQDLAKKISRSWRELGVELGVEDDQIEDILSDNVQFPSPAAKAHEVLKLWLHNDDSPTCGTLAEALKHVGRRDLAQKLLKQ